MPNIIFKKQDARFGDVAIVIKIKARNNCGKEVLPERDRLEICIWR